MTVDDPAKLGLVASLNRPGGNATGVNHVVAELGSKQLGLLHELVPAAARVGLLVNPNSALTQSVTRDVMAAASAIGLQINIVQASDSREIEAAFATLIRNRTDALLVGPDALMLSRRLQLAILAARYAIPTVYNVREYPEPGGLMSHQPALLSHDFPRFYAPNPRLGRAKSGWRHNGRECDALARSACELVHTAGVA